jgi:hypothetical protein
LGIESIGECGTLILYGPRYNANLTVEKGRKEHSYYSSMKKMSFSPTIWAFVFFGKHSRLNKNMTDNLCSMHGEVRNSYRSSVVKMKMKGALWIAGIDERM